MYNFDKDPTIAATTKETMWHQGYNITDDVFRSTLLTHINMAHHQQYEKKLAFDSTGFKSRCVVCKEDMTFRPVYKTIRASISRMVCEGCKDEHHQKMKDDDYVQKMVVVLTNRSLAMSKIITAKIFNFSSNKDSK